ncbi:MAG: ATP-binding cassette domain-containing protein [Thaumarchaeota archaeon]|nr:ATP-binding cassette domain-containing protein [Nitrososphaerota archaeon]
MYAIEINNLTKVFNKRTRAVNEISFTVQEGEIFGLLGPNGAGKTTAIRMITSLTTPTSGSIHVFGSNVSNSSEQVRQMVGYIPQSISVDADLTAYENLLIFAKLFYVNKNERDKRIRFALEYMGLSDRTDDLAKRFSGGMMRRLEVAQALVNQPKMLILDEPSIGLDPSSKMQMWKYLKKLNEDFHTTILITTHDMSEADELCDKIAIMSSGKIAVIGSPVDLKESVGKETLTITLKSQKSLSEQVLPVLDDGLGLVSQDGNMIKISTRNGEHAIPKILQSFRDAGLDVDSVSLNKITLDDVFIKYAKTRFESENTESNRDTRLARRTIRRRGG